MGGPWRTAALALRGQDGSPKGAGSACLERPSSSSKKLLRRRLIRDLRPRRQRVSTDCSGRLAASGCARYHEADVARWLVRRVGPGRAGRLERTAGHHGCDGLAMLRHPRFTFLVRHACEQMVAGAVLHRVDARWSCRTRGHAAMKADEIPSMLRCAEVLSPGCRGWVTPATTRRLLHRAGFGALGPQGSSGFGGITLAAATDLWGPLTRVAAAAIPATPAFRVRLFGTPLMSRGGFEGSPDRGLPRRGRRG